MSSLTKPLLPLVEVTKHSECAGDGCCSTTADGSMICNTSTSSKPIASNTAIFVPMDTIKGIHIVQTDVHRKSIWQKTRSFSLFAVACLASPCCTPLIVPIVLALLAGTPAALWLGQNLGWVYGMLTLISAISFVLALRLMPKPTSPSLSAPLKD